MFPITQKIPEAELEEFFSLGSTIGAYIIFPSQRIAGKATINGARGLNSKIKDRSDLTLECIRRHYDRRASPLSDVLDRYAAFFDLFGSFKAYVDFFLLQDMISDASNSIEFFLPFDDFDRSPLPSDLDEYRSYMSNQMTFIAARNSRISQVSG